MKFQLSNKVYDVLKFAAQVALPAVAVLYTALSTIWGFPYSAEIPATITALVLFLGTLLQLSSASYKASNG